MANDPATPTSASENAQTPLAVVTPPPAPAPPSYERFNKIAGGIQAIATSIALVAGGCWAWWQFHELVQARTAVAVAEKAEADAKAAVLVARRATALSMDISAQQIIQPDDASDKWIAVELAVKNSGNETYRVDLKERMRFYVARVLATSDNGDVEYGPRRKLRFDYPDKTIEAFLVQSGAEVDKLRTVQRLTETGLYIVRFSVYASGGAESASREYSAQTFIYIK